MTRQAKDAVSANLDEREAAPPLPTGPVDWRAEYASTAGVQAFIYGFPYICNAQLRHDWVTKRRDPIGDRTPGLVYDSGGGLTLHLQPEPPGAVEAAEGSSGNWLPTSADSPWFAILRLYRPQPTVLDGTWRCPPLSRTT